ncbi:aldose 1-epimerase family protein [Anaerocolumna sp. AGMB13025]|uniref:aldose 1-epimerase family protein n=1 Tax=Anaerocolumna sp. AGMB13025 TaxID=3039116 RepID=UPI00241DC7B5|nr:aldose 1-epimerase family protein [Anaerocolumna sp. AGMB13025]WFR58578.1 aldose 1-epimerase family protein [Anaerocolumna sp. AGMB13025]
MQYQLSNNKVTVKFDSMGGGIVSIQDLEGIEYLWQGDPAYWSGQAPVMFPICGSLRDKKAQIGEGLSCTMERHGLVRKSEFTYVGQSSDSITFSISSKEEFKARFPYDFELQITYLLKEKTITTSYKVINKNSIPMPYFIGGHPGFNCPLQKGETFEDYVIEFEQPETALCPESIPATGLVNVDNRLSVLNNETTLLLKHSYFSVDALIFDQLKSRSAKLTNPATKKGIRIDFADFDYFILWSSSNDGPFVAMEPWTGISTCNDESDVFEEKRGVKILPPNQSEELSFDLTVL